MKNAHFRLVNSPSSEPFETIRPSRDAGDWDGKLAPRRVLLFPVRTCEKRGASRDPQEIRALFTPPQKTKQKRSLCVLRAPFALYAAYASVDVVFYVVVHGLGARRRCDSAGRQNAIENSVGF